MRRQIENLYVLHTYTMTEMSVRCHCILLIVDRIRIDFEVKYFFNFSSGQKQMQVIIHFSIH